MRTITKADFRKGVGGQILLQSYEDGQVCPICAGDASRCNCTEESMYAAADVAPAPPPETRSHGLAQDSEGRKNQPMFRGLLCYFPDALAEVSELSRLANVKHNGGNADGPKWNRSSSQDEEDCIVRHLIDSGGFIENEYAKPVRHSVALAWRALALAQKEIEAARGDGKISRGSVFK
jgi:hypothetical protein